MSNDNSVAQYVAVWDRETGSLIVTRHVGYMTDGGQVAGVVVADDGNNLRILQHTEEFFTLYLSPDEARREELAFVKRRGFSANPFARYRLELRDCIRIEVDG